ncbi:type I fimbrial protein, A chain precursor (plasmid) [Enterobacter soli]|nr:hypothetical protein [Enterobacter soli]AEN67290.1 type I fimbrial protein, A chain precursor [Enterobacter soli]
MTALTSAGAMAADANINFTGTVSAATCTLAAADAAKTLTIPSVSPATLLAAGSNAYTTYYASSSFGFTACPVGLTRVTSAYTYQGSLVGNNNAVATGTASNVQMFVMQSSSPSVSSVLAVNGTSGSLNQATITANAATVPVIVGISSLNSSTSPVLATVGTYTGTYLVAFTYS